MPTKTREQTLYRYEDLPENVRDDMRYRDEHMQAEVCSDVSERLTSMLEELLGVSVGSPNSRRQTQVELAWSLSYSQGDGVAFYGRWRASDMLDALTKLLTGKSEGGWWDGTEAFFRLQPNIVTCLPLLKELVKHGYDISSEERDTHYCHYNTMRFEAEFYECPMATLGNTECAYEIPVDQWSALEDLLRDFSRELEREGYTYLEACESLDDMKYRYAGAWFDDNGRLVEYDEEDEREEHVTQLEAADDAARASTVPSTEPKGGTE